MEKIKALLYCCKNGKKLVDTFKYDFDFPNQKMSWHTLNGKIVAECDFEVGWWDTSWCCSDFIEHKGLEKSCLTKEQLFDYVKGRNGFYAIHIKNLKERVMELSDVYQSVSNQFAEVRKAPQNMMRVWIYEDGKWVMYILISVKPEWLYLELIGEKTVEVRKRVLRGML